MTVHDVRHVAASIDAAPAEVVRVAGDPRRLPEWAAGLAGTAVELRDGEWVADSPMGRVTVAFVAPNEHGVLDHHVRLPSGETVLNPLRVTPNGTGSDVVFTVVRRPSMSAAELEADAGAVAADLERLRALLEGSARRSPGE